MTDPQLASLALLLRALAVTTLGTMDRSALAGLAALLDVALGRIEAALAAHDAAEELARLTTDG